MPLPPLARLRLATLLCAAVFAVLGAVAARANDRPFQVARTAVMEDDDEVFGFEAWGQRRGGLRGFSIEPEYAFSPATSVQLELTRWVDRRGGGRSGHEAEVEFKHLFNHIARDGWGSGISLGLGRELSAEEGGRNSAVLRLPFSLALHPLIGSGSGTYLHVNLGLGRSQGERRQFTQALAAEHAFSRHATAFAEWVHQGRGQHYAQLGVRHWIKHEKVSFDVAWQQYRGAGVDGAESTARRASGLIIGLGWYDL